MGNNFVIDHLLTDKLTQVSEDMVWLQQSNYLRNFGQEVFTCCANQQIIFRISFGYKSPQTVTFCALVSHKLQTGGGTEAGKEDGEKADGNEESPLWHERGCLQVAVMMEVMNKERFGALSRPMSWGCSVIGE